MSQLDAGIISRAALALIAEHGVDGFSIRAVARSLGVTPMALYHHVRDKAALAELVVASVLADHPLTPETGEWRDDLWCVAQCSRAMTLANPAVSTILRVYDIWTPESHAIADRWMRHWRESGLDTERAVLAASTSSAAILGLVAEEKRERECDPPYNRPGLPDLPGAEQLLGSSLDADLRFELGFNAIVDGLLMRLAN
jgi:AcrR family transcriptional regulator